MYGRVSSHISRVTTKQPAVCIWPGCDTTGAAGQNVVTENRSQCKFISKGITFTAKAEWWYIDSLSCILHHNYVWLYFLHGSGLGGRWGWDGWCMQDWALQAAAWPSCCRQAARLGRQAGGLWKPHHATTPPLCSIATMIRYFPNRGRQRTSSNTVTHRCTQDMY